MSGTEKSRASLECCFSPALYKYRQTQGDFTVVVVDIFRATTSFVAALYYGVEKIIPLAGLEVARMYKVEGYPVAVERDGKILDFADYGNSAYNFMSPEVVGKTIAYSTTNGTEAIEVAKESKELLIGAFTNISVLSEYLINSSRNVLILCAGWKNKFNLEDTLFAGALSERLLQSGKFESECDSVLASLDIWEAGKSDPLEYIQKAQHRHRLRLLGVDDVLPYTFDIDAAPALPSLVDGALVDILKNRNKT